MSSRRPQAELTGVLRAAALYFGIVFAAGFALGVVRTLLVVPALGTRAAELAEMPVMLLVVWWAARRVDGRRGTRLAVGLLALALLLAAELGVAWFARGETPAEAVARRDPLAGTAYLLALGLFGLGPLLFGPRPVRGV